MLEIDATQQVMEPPVDTFAEPLEIPPDSRWPAVVGTISIVLGAIGILCYGCNTLFTTVLNPIVFQSLPEDQRPVTPGGMQLVLQIAQLCLAFALAVWLLFVGIGLCRRRRWSRGGAMAWSWGKLALSLVGTVVALIYLGDTVKQINDQMSQQPGGPPFQVSEAFMLCMIAVGFAVVLVWPCFLLIWMMRGRVREEVALWT